MCTCLPAAFRLHSGYLPDTPPWAGRLALNFLPFSSVLKKSQANRCGNKRPMFTSRSPRFFFFFLWINSQRLSHWLNSFYFIMRIDGNRENDSFNSWQLVQAVCRVGTAYRNISEYVSVTPICILKIYLICIKRRTVSSDCNFTDIFHEEWLIIQYLLLAFYWTFELHLGHVKRRLEPNLDRSEKGAALVHLVIDLSWPSEVVVVCN